MSPVIVGVEVLHEGRMLLLSFLRSGGVLRIGISQAELDGKLSFDLALPRLSFFDVTWLDF